MKTSGIAFTAVLCFAACSPTNPPDNGDGSSGSSGSSGASGSSGSSGNGGTTGTGGTSGSAGTSGKGGVPGFELDCEGPEVGSAVLRLLTRTELTNTINDVFPGIQNQWTSTLPASTVSPFGFDNDVSATVGNQLAQKLLETAESIATAVTGNALSNLLPCSTSSPNATCASDFVARYGRRLFRRPLTSAESQRYLTLFNSVSGRSDFETGIKWVTVGLIQSPHAVYRREIGTAGGSGRTLTPHEIATELAYTYTSTTPTEELLAQADSGTLTNLPNIAQSLLATDRGKASVQRFFEAYLGYARASSIERPSAAEYAQRAPDMVQETRAFIDGVILQGGGGVRELLTSPNTYPSRSLATFYGSGFPMPGSDYAVVTRPANHGIGILAQGSFLATHANAMASSPTQRGVFTYLRLLCQEKPEVPDDVPEIGEPEPGVRTTRQRYEEVHAAPNTPCAGCHSLFDPIGFGFEHFDEVGRYRADENGLPIDASGEVAGPTGEPLFAFTSQEELAQGLASQKISHQCFSAYLALYAFGTSQKCLGASSADALFAGSKGITQAFADLAAEPHFTTRR
jgi:hypothetical protein